MSRCITCNTHFHHKVAQGTLKSNPAIYGVFFLMLFSNVGLKESSVISHADSLMLAELEDEVRRQVGVVYSQDCQ